LGLFAAVWKLVRPWNDWYHCTGNTYGTWLRGDPRGFRERHHRRHVEGDYKNPPPKGTYESLHRYSKHLMKGIAVKLNHDMRDFVCRALVSKLLCDDIEVLVVAMGAQHFHLLARFPDHESRHWVGRAKKHASHLLKDQKKHPKLWAVRSRAEPIKNREHQLNTFRYIQRHAEDGAAVWTFREEPPELY